MLMNSLNILTIYLLTLNATEVEYDRDNTAAADQRQRHQDQKRPWVQVVAVKYMVTSQKYGNGKVLIWTVFHLSLSNRAIQAVFYLNLISKDSARHQYGRARVYGGGQTRKVSLILVLMTKCARSRSLIIYCISP